jgi:uncharacterized protein (DUF952 family)
MNIILHIASVQSWEQATQQGLYWSDTLETEGFIHCSTQEQIADVSRQFFQGQRDLLLLFIDEENVHAPILYEALAADRESPQRFPHIYGPLNLDAVVWVVPFTPQEISHLFNQK